MSESNPIRVFIVHPFREYPDYLRVFEYMESRPNFYYQNCSRPDAPAGGTDGEARKEELQRQMESCEIVVLPVTAFALDPVLVTFQVNSAKALKKPVLAIKSFGDTLALSRSLLEKADDIVDWNDRAITEAIKRLARQDSSGQWEVIEFTLE